MANLHTRYRRFHHVAALSLLGAAAFAGPSATAAPVTYTGFVVTDVRLGGHFYHNAAVTLTFYADTNDVQTFSVTAPDGGSASGFLVDKGRATVQIQSASLLVTATFAPKQILVSLDTSNGGFGFSSYITPTDLEAAYPLGLVANTGAPDSLTSETNVTGNAWSCIGFPPRANAGDCIDPAGHPLKTNHGNFFIYNPYKAYFTDGTISSHGGTMNRGIFSIVLRKSDE